MELNREQIIKALEWCASGGSCLGCKYDRGKQFSKAGCMAGHMRDALALIKQLAEENERLGVENFDLICKLSRIKEDTVREFAEALKDRIHPDADHSGYELRGIVDLIAKEMLED